MRSPSRETSGFSVAWEQGVDVSEQKVTDGGGRFRVYQVSGIVLAVLFLALGVAAFLAGGGPIIAAIAVIGGLTVLVVSIVTMVRS